jgi:hypothetical protein
LPATGWADKQWQKRARYCWLQWLNPAATKAGNCTDNL